MGNRGRRLAEWSGPVRPGSPFAICSTASRLSAAANSGLPRSRSNWYATMPSLRILNPGKADTYVLDFVNEPDEILAAFKAYYETAQLSDATDPNLILNLRTKLDALGYYDEHEIDRVVNVVLDPTSKQKQLEAAITPVAERLLKRFSAAKAALAEAIEKNDEKAAQAARDTMDALILFRTDVATYLRAYNACPTDASSARQLCLDTEVRILER